MDKKKTYVVASSRAWNKPGFLKIQLEVEGEWLWVTTQEELEQALLAVSPRYIFFLHWNWLVPKKIWEDYECVCFHMTDLPYGRGGSPLQNLILRGHTETKLTAFRMIEEFDAGPIYMKEGLALNGVAQEIYMRAGELSYDMIRSIIMREPAPVPQLGAATYFHRRKPCESEIPQDLTAEEIFDFVRMLDAEEYPRAFLKCGSYRLELSGAKLEDGILNAVVSLKPLDTKV